MDFSKVKDSFSEWANASGLMIQTEYKGEEVRSTDIFDENGCKWQLWLVPVNESDQCVIHYWNYKDISRHIKIDNSDLLEKLYQIRQNIKNGNVK